MHNKRYVYLFIQVIHHGLDILELRRCYVRIIMNNFMFLNYWPLLIACIREFLYILYGITSHGFRFACCEYELRHITIMSFNISSITNLQDARATAIKYSQAPAFTVFVNTESKSAQILYGTGKLLYAKCKY